MNVIQTTMVVAATTASTNQEALTVTVTQAMSQTGMAKLAMVIAELYNINPITNKLD